MAGRVMKTFHRPWNDETEEGGEVNEFGIEPNGDVMIIDSLDDSAVFIPSAMFEEMVNTRPMLIALAGMPENIKPQVLLGESSGGIVLDVACPCGQRPLQQCDCAVSDFPAVADSTPEQRVSTATEPGIVYVKLLVEDAERLDVSAASPSARLSSAILATSLSPSPDAPRWTSDGRSLIRMVSPSVNRTVRSTTFSSARMLPGQA